MTTSKTQIGFLDLAAFYDAAKKLREFSYCTSHVGGKSVTDLCDKLTCVIDAIRADGLDPRWNPERDALLGLDVRIFFDGQGFVTRCRTSESTAKDIIDGLHQRGYKIVKDDSK